MATATKNSPVKDAQNGSVRVEIFDQAYNLRGSEYRVHREAGGIRRFKDACSCRSHQHDRYRPPAVLAALNIADEYHLLKRNQENGSGDYQKRAHQLAKALDEVLAESRKAG